MTNPPSSLEAAISSALTKRQASSTLRKLTLNPPGSIDFSSNDFLSLASSSDLRARYLQLLSSPQSHFHSGLHLGPILGSGGSRLLDGNSSYAESLEHDISTFHNAPSGLLCNSGFDANVGLFAALPQPGDVVIYDEYIHASVHDGLRLSRASRTAAFVHNDLSSLRTLLRSYTTSDELIRNGHRSVFIAVEAVYSMDGDTAPLVAIVRLIRELLPQGNGHLIVDEAHSNGVFGSHGRGLVCELGLEKECTVRLHTFGKALACNGAILLCSPLIREYLVNYARPMIYTTFMSYPAQAAIRASYAFLMEGRAEQLRRNLRRLISALHVRLLEMQIACRLPPGKERLLQCPRVCPQTPIFAILSSESRSLAEHCQRNGLVVRAIMPPTVPVGGERVRVCLHAGNTIAQIDRLVDTIRVWVEDQLQTGGEGSVETEVEAVAVSSWRARL